MDDKKAKGLYIFCTCLWSLLTLLRRWCAVSSGWLAAWRSLLAIVSLLLILLCKKQKLDWKSMKAHAVPLVLSGIFLGLNWVAFMEALAAIPVSIATILYNLEAIFVILVSPFVFRERITLRSSVCVLVALIGMALTSGVIGESGFRLFERTVSGETVWIRGNLWGAGCAVMGAAFFAAMTVTNKKITRLGATERTMVQFLSAFAVTLLYACLREPLEPAQYDPRSLLMVVLIGVVMTGIAYYYYFDTLPKLTSRTIAVWSYMNPLCAVVIGVLFLHEELTLWVVFGGILILGSTFVCELPPRVKKVHEG